MGFMIDIYMDYILNVGFGQEVSLLPVNMLL